MNNKIIVLIYLLGGGGGTEFAVLDYPLPRFGIEHQIIIPDTRHAGRDGN